MKKKIFVGLFASVLVCLAFVFTNASTSSFSVSGTVEMSIDGDTPQPISGASVELINPETSEVMEVVTTNGKGNFHISDVSSSSRLRYSYSDNWGSSNTEERQYFKETSNERITLHYQSNSSN